jgi:hypothetical protein
MPLEHPPLLWITLWATLGSAPESLETTGLPTDCSNFKQVKTFENQ